MAYITDTFRPTFTGSPVINRVTLWLDAMRQRKALRRMTLSQLEDIGVTEAEADHESRRAFWDVARRR